MRIAHKNERLSLILYMLLLMSVGIFTKIYKGPGFAFIHNKLGGVFYVMFWAFLAKILFYEWRSVYLVSGVFALSCGIEFSQLLTWDCLEWIRNSFIGMTLIGQSFNFSDMVYYTFGAGLAYFLLKRMERKYA